jgi:hypothetical protein
MSSTVPFRSLLGVLIKDLPRYVPALLADNHEYLALCNRNEVLHASPDGRGYRCAWRWASNLHAPRILPALGRQLMRRGLADHPVEKSRVPNVSGECPAVTFVIGHRGMMRVPHLVATIGTIAAQRHVSVECVVVEQDTESRLRRRLPAWVRHVYTPTPTPDMPYCRSWAFNVGARSARGALLVLHDNDVLVPVDYANELVERAREGWEVINLKRFIFYLGQNHTQQIFNGEVDVLDHAPEAITQNLEAGASVAITRDAYARIGGMDEGFVGWGGEDNEFWERAQTLRVWPYGFLPFVHLWHTAQAGKYEAGNPALARYRMLSTVDVGHRIQRLLATASGAMGLSAGNYRARM